MAWQPVAQVHWPRIGHIAFAGGGNRCWWQGGVCDTLVSHGFALPRHFSGTSAGIAIATSLAGGTAHDALAPCAALYAGNPHMVCRQDLRAGRLRFAHQHIFPAWLDSFVTAARWQQARARGHQLHVAVARFLGPQLPGLASSLGLLAYLADKFVLRQVHPCLPAQLGFRVAFLSTRDDTTPTDLKRLLVAAAAASPIIKSPPLEGKMAMDGGFVDNAPVAPLSAQELGAGDQTLVLLTRHYRRLPPLFQVADRVYWQPSRAVPVSTWRCTPGTDVAAAYAHGQADALHALGQRRFITA